MSTDAVPNLFEKKGIIDKVVHQGMVNLFTNAVSDLAQGVTEEKVTEILAAGMQRWFKAYELANKLVDKGTV